VIEVSP